MYSVGIVTLSDKGADGLREDLSGPRIAELLPKDRYEVVSYKILSDDEDMLKNELIRLCDEERCDLVLTTGGTGLSKRDITPEATLCVAQKNVPGIAEGLRAYSMQFTKRAILSRGVSVIRNKTLIINLPGSVKAVSESMEFLIGNIEHGLDIMLGYDSECGKEV